MKKTTFLAALLLCCAAVSSSRAATIASWGFEVHVPPTTNGPAIGGLLPDFGSGSASAFHANIQTSFTTPAGNGSAHSLSANNWTIGDYWLFHVSTLGFQNIQLSMDQAAAFNGPTNFNLLISTDGTTYTTAFSNLGVPSSLGLTNVFATRTLDLSSFTQLNNATDVYFRLSSNIPGTGTGLIDNFIVSGLAVPEPGSMLLITGGALLLIHQRRRSSWPG
jgi:hypothetical protein